MNTSQLSVSLPDAGAAVLTLPQPLNAESLGLRGHARWIGALTHKLGALVILLALGWGGLLLWRQYRRRSGQALAAASAHNAALASSAASARCVTGTTFTSGLMAAMAVCKDSALGWPMRSRVWATWRWRLVASTTSWS